MIRLRVQHRLTLTFGLFAIAVFGIGGFLVYERARSTMEGELGEKLLSTGAVVLATIPDSQRRVLVATRGESRIARGIQRQLESYRDAARLHRLYVFDVGHTALADADGRDPGTVIPDLAFEEAALAGVFAGEDVVGHLFTARDGKVYKAAYLPLTADDEILAALAVVGSAAALESIERVRTGILFAAAIGLSAAILLSFLLARTIVAPIRRLMTSADRIRAGDLETSVEDVGRDEIGYLGLTLERMREAVLARERSLRAMLGGVAHEVRNPLGGIELFAGLLRRRVEADPKSVESVDRILHEVHHLNGIITDFLEYARPVEPDRNPFRVRDVLQEVEDLVIGEFRRDGVALEIDAGEHRVLADRAQFRQVLLNLILNAKQAQESGGRVRVQVGAESGDDVRILVDDAGPGIPEEVRERVFEPFFTTRQQGSGLGLALARQLTERNEGTLELAASSDLGGARVAMRWPAPEGNVR
jgi:signal transduction histidine kinase